MASRTAKRKRGSDGVRIESLGYEGEIIGVYARELLIRRNKGVVIVSQDLIGNGAVVTLNEELLQVAAYTPETQLALLYGPGARLVVNNVWTGDTLMAIDLPFPEPPSLLSAAVRFDGFIAAAFSNGKMVLCNPGTPFQHIDAANVEAIGFVGLVLLVAANNIIYQVADDLQLHRIANYTGTATSISAADGEVAVTTTDMVALLSLPSNWFRTIPMPGARCAAIENGRVWVLHGLDGVSCISDGEVVKETQLPFISEGYSKLPLIAIGPHHQPRTSPGQTGQLYLLD